MKKALAAITLALFPVAVRAQEAIDRVQRIGERAGFKQQDPRAVVASIIYGVLSLCGVLLVIYLVYGGINYMLAGGNDDRIETAKKAISRSIIGLLIILVSYSITATIVFLLGKAV